MDLLPNSVLRDASPTLETGRYVLLEQIGRGGMAAVFRAWDHRLKVWRAIKIMLPELAEDKILRERFTAEAHTLARLEHPHLVRVYDVGRDGSVPFLVMELVEGGTLGEWSRRFGPMSRKNAAKAIWQVATGLGATHKHGVVHRDVKPQNVLITVTGSCKLGDFGVARRPDTTLTAPGTAVGTIGFMAPEQRNDNRVDHRADIYGLGATLYNVLTAKPAHDLFALSQDVGMLKPIPEVLRPIIIRCCAYRPEDRYADVAEVEMALRLAIDKLPAEHTAIELTAMVEDWEDPPTAPTPPTYESVTEQAFRFTDRDFEEMEADAPTASEAVTAVDLPTQEPPKPAEGAELSVAPRPVAPPVSPPPTPSSPVPPPAAPTAKAPAAPQPMPIAPVPPPVPPPAMAKPPTVASVPPQPRATTGSHPLPSRSPVPRRRPLPIRPPPESTPQPQPQPQPQPLPPQPTWRSISSERRSGHHPGAQQPAPRRVSMAATLGVPLVLVSAFLLGVGIMLAGFTGLGAYQLHNAAKRADLSKARLYQVLGAGDGTVAHWLDSEVKNATLKASYASFRQERGEPKKLDFAVAFVDEAERQRPALRWSMAPLRYKHTDRVLDDFQTAREGYRRDAGAWAQVARGAPGRLALWAGIGRGPPDSTP